MLFVDVKYANLISPYVRNFRRKSEYLWNFSCCFCGDSKTNKTKARGYIYKLKTGLAYKCHKCGHSTSLGSLLKYVDSNLYQEYTLENYKESGAPRSAHKDVDDAIPAIIHQPQVDDDVLLKLKRLDKLSLDHPAVKYVIKRKIPTKQWHLLYFCPRFIHFVNSLIPGKIKSAINEHPRLIIPYFGDDGKCFAFQGRAFGNETPKYMTIKLDDTKERIYGQERLDRQKRVYIVEGPLDSLFIPNAVAVSGSSFDTPAVHNLKQNATVVYDNERRSPQLLKLIEKTIEQQFSICLWPDTIEQKDINDMVKSGMTVDQIIDIIDSNTFTGPEAVLRFSTWRRG